MGRLPIARRLTTGTTGQEACPTDERPPLPFESGDNLAVSRRAEERCRVDPPETLCWHALRITLLGLQGISETVKNYYVARGWEEPNPRPKEIH